MARITSRHTAPRLGANLQRSRPSRLGQYRNLRIVPEQNKTAARMTPTGHHLKPVNLPGTDRPRLALPPGLIAHVVPTSPVATEQVRTGVPAKPPDGVTTNCVAPQVPRFTVIVWEANHN